jgi:pimeloyl-ACP methyl ester carboxylesterase
MRQRLASGVELGYESAGAGRPVVWLHAFPLARPMWRPQLEAVPDGWSYLAPDLRGFGESDPFGVTESRSVDTMADDVAGLLDALGVTGRVVVGGLSMGGYVALAFARRHPDRLAGLILADTRAEADSDEARANRDKQIAGLASQSVADLFETMLPKLLGDTSRARRPEVVAEARRVAAAQSSAGVADALRALRDRPDATPDLGRVEVPTLVLVGAEDTVTPPSAAEALVRGIPGARLVTVPEAGHLSNLEQPAAFNRAVEELLRTLA